MARLLLAGGLDDEAHEPLAEAILWLGRALAIENHLAEPANPAEAILPRLANAWRQHATPVRPYVDGDHRSGPVVLQAIQTLLSQPCA